MNHTVDVQAITTFDGRLMRRIHKTADGAVNWLKTVTIKAPVEIDDKLE